MDVTAARVARISLSMPLTGESQEASFIAKQTGNHELRIEFPWPITDDRTSRALQGAVASVTTGELPPEFDFVWILSRNNVEVGRGTARNGVSGITDSGTYPLGGGTKTARGLVFGRFWLEVGTQYLFKLTPGETFLPLILAGSPTVEIELRGCSIENIAVWRRVRSWRRKTRVSP